MVDLLLSFPGFLLALTLIAVLGVGIINVVVSVGAGDRARLHQTGPRRGPLLREQIVCARRPRRLGARGGPRDRRRHVLPNCLAPVIVQSTLSWARRFWRPPGSGSSGLGVKPPTPEWGTMLGEGQTYLFSSWYIATFPGIAIFLAVMAFNLLGDGLRDALDPRMKLR